MDLASLARDYQIMDFLMLAPDIQEALLVLPPVHKGRDPITERDLRILTARSDWTQQQRKWIGTFPAV